MIHEPRTDEKGSDVRQHEIALVEIQQIDLLRRLKPETRQAVADCATRVVFNKDEIILEQHESSTDVYFLVSGQVRVNMVASTGRQITYELLERGQMFGEISAVDGLPRSAGIHAETNVTLLKLRRDSFDELLTLYPDFARQILERVVGLCRWLTEKVYEYHAYDVKGRIFSDLLRMDREHEGNGFSITDRDMASRVGTTRENVTRIYGELKRAGLVARKGSTIQIVNREKLSSLRLKSEFG